MHDLLKIVGRLGVAAALLGSGLAAWAEPKWQNVGLWDKGTFYIDRQSVQKDGDFRKLSTALDYREAQKNLEGKAFRSTRSLLHIDCKNQTVRTLHLAMYAGPMLTGKVVEAEGILNEWQPVPTDTPMHRIVWMAC